MIDELAGVVLATDLPEHDLRAGDIGSVVLVHQSGQGYTAVHHRQTHPEQPMSLAPRLVQ